MRERVTSERLQEFMRILGDRLTQQTRVFLVGGATAVLFGWRNATIDIDLKVIPDSDESLQLFSILKDRLDVNIELASPVIPALPGWEERSSFIAQVGKVTFLHYDFYAQALAKIERGHDFDLSDLHHLLKARLIDAKKLMQLFSQVEDQLFRYPAVNPEVFRRAVKQVVSEAGQ